MDTYEQKYNEALEMARNLYPSVHEHNKKMLEQIFPELRESEDEKVRQWIREHINHDGTNMFDKAVAWLEKQKEQKQNPLEDYSRGYNDGYYHGITESEQKPASTEDMPYIADEHFYEREPADTFKYKLAEYMTKCCTKKEGPDGYTYGISAETILKMAEEELLKRGVVQKPAEWSEVELEFRGEKVKVKRPFFRDEKGRGYSTTEQDEDVSWSALRAWCEKKGISMYDLYPQAEWSEEDEKIRGRIIKILEQANENWRMAQNSVPFGDLILWLKSLRPQPKQMPADWTDKDKRILDDISKLLITFNYKEMAREYKQAVEKLIYQPHWKPSDEQMQALYEVAQEAPITKENGNYLYDLYEQLKSL